MTKLQTSLDALKVAMSNKLSAKPPSAVLADNATLLNGKTPAAITAENAALVQAHNALNNNPHGVTAAQADVPTTAAITALAATKLPFEQVPVSYFSKMDGVAPPISNSGLTINIGADIPALLAGKYLKMPATSFTLPAFSNVFLHIRLISGVPTYVIESFNELTFSRTPDSLTNMCVGLFQTNGTSVIRTVFRGIRRVGTKRYINYPYMYNKYMVAAAGKLDSFMEVAGLYCNGDRMFALGKGITLLQFYAGDIIRGDVFDTDSNPAENDRMLTFVNETPANGCIVAFSYDAFTGNLNQTGLNALAAFGVDTATFSASAKYRSAFLALGKKGSANGSATVRQCGQGTDVLAAGDVDSSVVIDFQQSEANGFFNVVAYK